MKRLVLLLGLAGLLTACGDGTKSTSPQALPPINAGSTAPTAPSAAPTGTQTSQGPVPPTRSSQTAKPMTPDPGEVRAATDFARSWLGAIDRAYADVDYRELQRLSDAGCQTCNNLIGSVKEAASLHLRYRGGQTSILDVAAPPVEDGRTAVIAVVSYAAADELGATGAVVRTLPAVAKMTSQIQLQRTGSGWIVTEMNRL